MTRLKLIEDLYLKQVSTYLILVLQDRSFNWLTTTNRTSPYEQRIWYCTGSISNGSASAPGPWTKHHDMTAGATTGPNGHRLAATPDQSRASGSAGGIPTGDNSVNFTQLLGNFSKYPGNLSTRFKFGGAVFWNLHFSQPGTVQVRVQTRTLLIIISHSTS